MVVLLRPRKRRQTPVPWSAGVAVAPESGGLQIGGGGFALPRIGLDVEAKLLALDQAAHAGALDGRDMHEHIGAASILHDEPEALLGIEKLDGTSGHLSLLENAQRRHSPFEPLGRITNPDLACYGEGPRGRQPSKLNRERRVYRGARSGLQLECQIATQARRAAAAHGQIPGGSRIQMARMPLGGGMFGARNGAATSWLRPHSRTGRSAPCWRSLPPPPPPSQRAKRCATSSRWVSASDPSS